jgi:hypothetical protein
MPWRKKMHTMYVEGEAEGGNGRFISLLFVEKLILMSSLYYRKYDA